MEKADIFYVLNSRWPTIRAYGLQVARTCEALKRAGARVRLVVPIRARHREIADIDPFTLYGVTDPFRLIRVPSLDFARMHVNGRVAFHIQQTLFAVLAALAVMFRPGAVYSRDQFTLYLLSFVRRDLYWEVHRVPEDLGGRLYRRLLATLSGVIVITEGIRRVLIERGVPSDKILVAPDGIDVAEFEVSQTTEQARNELGLDTTKHIVMYVGHLFEWKGVEVLIDAAQHLDDRFQVVVVGGTEQDVARVKTRDGSGRVRFVSFQHHGRIPLWLRAADTVVLPNRKDAGISEFYTSPLKMFEYMASGKPIVASDLPSLRELLNDHNALLVRPDDPQALAEGIKQSETDTMGAKVRAERARADVGRYDWNGRGKRILAFMNHRHALPH